MRLFLLPGVGHCGGGVGTRPGRLPRRAWNAGAKHGVAPAQIIASRNPGRGNLTPMTRPLCPYPQVRKYTGTGSTDDAQNFVCAAP